MRSLRDPSKPTYFEPQGGAPKGEDAEATPASAPGVPPSGATDNPSDHLNSADQDEDVEFGRRAARRLRMMIFLVNIFGSIGTILTPIPRTNTKN